MTIALVCVSNQLPDPERNWPVIHKTLADVCEQKGITEVRLLLIGPNELEVMDKIGLPVEVRCLSWVSIKSWTNKWMSDLFRIMGRIGCDWLWFEDRLDVSQSPVCWRLERVGLMIVIRSTYEPGVYGPLLLAAWERDVSVARIDPVTGAAFRVTAPSVGVDDEGKKGGSGEAE